MRPKLDENLGRGAAAQLQQAGHEVSTVPEQGLAGVSDRTLIEVCQAEGRCLVTLDLEFGNPLIFDPAHYPGIVVLRLPARPAPEGLVDAVQTLIGGLTQWSVAGKLWIIQRSRIREYQPKGENGTTP